MGWSKWRGEELVAKMLQANINAVEKTCYVILEEAQQQVPLREGALLRSGIVLMDNHNLPIGYISFGGGANTGHSIVPYAKRWHENSANFQRGRKKRYLADPLNSVGPPTLRKFLNFEVKQVLGGP